MLLKPSKFPNEWKQILTLMIDFLNFQEKQTAHHQDLFKKVEETN